MDAVRCDDESAFDNSSIGERYPGRIVVLLEADAAVSGMHHMGWQGFGQYLDEIGAVHTEGRVPARRIRYLHRGDGRSVLPKVPGIGTNPRAQPFHRRRSEEHTSELQSRLHLVCRLLLEKKKKNNTDIHNDNKKKKIKNKLYARC